MSTPVFVLAVVALIGVALVIRRSRFTLPLTLGLAAVLIASLVLMTLGVKPAAWGALIGTTLIVFTLFPHGGLGDD